MEKWTATVLAGKDREFFSWFLAYQGLSLQEAEARAAAEGRLCRVLRPGWMRMDDLIPERLNFQLAEDGTLVELWPG
jgi:hypothetical protein